MFKRIAVLLVLVVYLVGCSGSGTTPSSQAPSQGSAPSQSQQPTANTPIVLDFPSWQAEEPGFAEFWKDLIAEFESTHENVTVKLTQIPFKNYVDTMTTRFAGNNPPDIVHLPSRNFAQFAAQGWLASLDDLLKDTDIPQNWTALQQEMVWDGKTQGVLLMGYGMMLYYNEKLLQDCGFSGPPTTPDELIAAARACTKDDVFGFGTVTTEHPNIYSDVSIFVIGVGSHWVKDGQYNFSDPAMIEGVNYWRELLKYAPKGTTSEQKRQLFFDGKIAMMMDGPFVLASSDSAPESVRPHVKIAHVPFPHIAGSVSNSLHIPASLSEEKKALVWDFIQLAASPKYQALYAEYTKSPAPRKGAVTDETIQKIPEMELFAEATELAVPMTPASKNIQQNYNEYSKIISAAMMKLMTTDADTASVLAELQAELESKVRP
ncbi:MAG: sugar ABC transporter substrate-binding protein [Symbiobacterium sp.]|uniref:sugar ABC transporter substrate-binding protein n=1 Tax=Symbiobacterium sp. TaxID=1971213 RepID=UPI003463DA58